MKILKRISSVVLLICLVSRAYAMQDRDHDWRGPVTAVGVGAVAVVGLVALVKYYSHKWAVEAAQRLLQQDRTYVAEQINNFAQFNVQQPLDPQLQAMRDYAVRVCYTQTVPCPMATFVELLRADLHRLKNIAQRRATVDELIADQWTVSDEQFLREKLRVLIQQEEQLLVTLSSHPAYVSERDEIERRTRESRVANDQHRVTEEQLRMSQTQRENLEIQNFLTAAQAREADAKARKLNAQADEQRRKTVTQAARDIRHAVG